MESLHKAQSQGASQTTINQTLIDSKTTITDAISDLLIELQHRGYCTCKKILDGNLHCTITPSGIDLVEYSAKCPKAINRPSL